MFNNKSISVQAFGLINATIEGIQPTIDVSPEEVDGMKRKIANILGSIRHRAEVSPGNYVPDRVLAKTFKLEADITYDIILESELRSLAILIEGLC